MILIVDDKQENIFSLRTILSQQGFAVDTAQSGEEALKKLLKSDYALIILDVQMPGMDGFEVAEAITGLNRTRDIPIIFLSAVNTHKKFITKGFESGAVDYLTKPVDADILTLKVRNLYSLYEKTLALKKAEKALTETVNELHTTLEVLPQLAFTTDRQGKLEYVNRQWMAFSASPTEFPQTAPGVPPLDRQWQSLILKSEPVEIEVAIRKLEDGLYYHHLLRATPITVNGYVKRWVGTLTAIHEQKKLNEILERKVAERTRELLETNRELQISNDDLQQFTSVASHDLKEPLRKIQFFGNILKERASLNKDLYTYLEKMINASNRMSNLINDLLSFASLSRPGQFMPTDINSILIDILNDFELTLEEKNAEVSIAPIPVIEVIPALIRQLLQNLISNALKFTRPGVKPLISITAERIDHPSAESAPDRNGRFCRIVVADNGIGFEEQYADKIFTIFQRLNARTEYEGTGIGLAIAKKIVERHNGLLMAKSTPEAGSSFIIILPVTQEPQQDDQLENQVPAKELK